MLAVAVSIPGGIQPGSTVMRAPVSWTSTDPPGAIVTISLLVRAPPQMVPQSRQHRAPHAPQGGDLAGAERAARPAPRGLKVRVAGRGQQPHPGHGQPGP